MSWGYENVWVKKETKSILLGKELILSVSLENMKMQLVFGTFWEEHIAGDAGFKKLLKDKQDLLDRPSKGDGKGKSGKPGKAGKVPASS